MNYSLAQAWKAYTDAAIKHEVSSPEAESMFWAFNEMVDTVRDKPFEALEVILEILKIAEEEQVLANLAAGPLEDLLAEHGIVVIDRIIELAKSDPRFRDLLQGVWGNSVDPRVWKMIRATETTGDPNNGLLFKKAISPPPALGG